MSESIGKRAERKIREWLNRPEDGYYFWRLPDQTFGIPGDAGSNPCDFFLYKYPDFYAIESKSTINDRFDFSLITQYQHDSLLKISAIEGCHGCVTILYVEHKRAFLLDIRDIKSLEDQGTKSLNIKKIDKWAIPYKEIRTVPSRKEMLDYDKENNIL